VALLEGYGHTVAHARRVLPGAADDRQLLLASRTGRVLVTGNRAVRGHRARGTPVAPAGARGGAADGGPADGLSPARVPGLSPAEQGQSRRESNLALSSTCTFRPGTRSKS